MKYAPIALFVYNRPDHLIKTLSYLKKNSECKFTELFIFSDGYKSENVEDKKKVNEVRKIIKKIKFFKKKNIIIKKKNFGLKKNIISGINYVFKKNSRIIILEDDIIVGKHFLNYMNNSLNKYNSIKKIWHISGWNYQISLKNYKFDAFFTRNMNCWGWGTWKDRWIKIKYESSFFIKKFDKRDKYLFDLNNSFENFSQILRNADDKISTWAIFWNATIFYNNGLCLNPIKSLTKNIGQDKSGTNSVNNQLINKTLNSSRIFKLPDVYFEDLYIRQQIISSLKKNTHEGKFKIFNYFLNMYNRLFY